MVTDDNVDASGIPNTIFWFLAIWVVLVLFALVWGVGNAETTLQAEASQRLIESGENVAVDFSGRDARLIGSVGSQEVADEIVESIDAIPGVRNVKSELEVVKPPPPVVRDPEVSVRVIGEVISVRGLIPSTEVETQLIEAAEAVFGVGRVVNALVVDENVTAPPWLGKIHDLIPLVGRLRSGGFVANDTGFEIRGEVISEAVRSELLQEIALVLDEALPITADLTIAVLPEPSFTATGSGGVLTLDGILPDQETVDQIEGAARRLHEGTTIVNSMRVGDVAGPTWLEIVDGLLDVVTRLEPWTMEISGGSVAITGLALDEDLAAAVDVLAMEVVGGQLAVNTDVRVNPAAIAIKLTELLRGRATFEPNGVVLSAEGVGLLDSAISILEANPLTVLVVEGHTDNQGDAEVNLLLSQQRAEVVVAYLVDGGIAADRLTAVGFGEEEPVADNSTEEGRAQNRRIEFSIQEGDG